MKFLGGPLDGTDVKVNSSEKGPFFIFKAISEPEKDILYCCYEAKDNRMVFVNSKNEKQMKDYYDLLKKEGEAHEG